MSYRVLQRRETVVEYGAITATTEGTTVTGNAAANTKGAWTQLVAATARPTHSISVAIYPVGNFEGLLDIGIGGAGSEVVLVPNLIFGGRSVSGMTYNLPMYIPQGSRVALRLQATSGGSVTTRAVVYLHHHNLAGFPSFQKCVAYGADTTDSGGTQIDPGGVADTKGGYSPLVAATTQRAEAVMLAVGLQNNIARTLAEWLMDFAIGAAASEVNLLDNWMFALNASADIIVSPVLPLMGYAIPSGTRLSAQSQCSITDASDRLLDLFCYAFS